MDELEIEYVKVHTLSDRFEADVIANALEQEGIEVMVRLFTETAYSNIFVAQKGWGYILAPRQKAELARQIISEFTRMWKEEDLRPSGQSEIEQAGPARPGSYGQRLSQVTEQLAALQIEPGLWEALRQADPGEVASRAAVEFDPQKNGYIVPILNGAVLCSPWSQQIEPIGEPSFFSRDFQLSLAVVHYLLYAQNKVAADKWVSEKDLPGGSLFFTAAHALPMDLLVAAFDGRPDLLEKAALGIGGQKTDIAALSYRFSVLPRIAFLLIFWEGDEEFASSCHLLFDETIAAHFSSLDLVWALVNVFIQALLASAASF
ncbi:MAG: DUF3786 domain-containing protein [Syntrophobacteraceae bacterium]